jgi:catechol 2,3-dioxygenase-like lactoylglutathione lyase family enzyme
VSEAVGNVASLGFAYWFVKLPVRDLAAMEAFYNRALGLEVRDRMTTPDFEEILMAGPGEEKLLILIHYLDTRERDGSNGTLGYVTGDLDAARAHLIACGAAAKGEILDLGFVRVCLVDDPEGNEIELIERRAA